MTKTKVIKEIYTKAVKPIFFKTDPETIHDLMTNMSNFAQQQDYLNKVIEPNFRVDDKILEQNIAGINFTNPVGLAAGFDYEAKFTVTAKSLGFGFNTLGTVTAKYYDGNPKPRLVRLPKSQSILVNKGFKSPGIDFILNKLDKLNIKNNHILGLSIGSSNIDEVDTIEKAIDDYVYSFSKAKDKNYIKYFELNISCPNTRLKENFGEVANLELLLKEVNKLNIKQPIFIKLANELTNEKLDSQLKLAIKYGIKAGILSNLIKDRNNDAFDKTEIARVVEFKGNFSGKPTSQNSINLIKHAYKNFGKDIKIIGCGGIFNAKDAYERIKAGASLVELITGMIYEGPQIVKDINEGLIGLLKKDRFGNISEVIGIDTK